MVLEGDEIETHDVGEPGQLEYGLPLGGDRRDEDAEAEVLAVVGHGKEALPPAGPQCTKLVSQRPGPTGTPRPHAGQPRLGEEPVRRSSSWRGVLPSRRRLCQQLQCEGPTARGDPGRTAEMSG